MGFSSDGGPGDGAVERGGEAYGVCSTVEVAVGVGWPMRTTRIGTAETGAVLPPLPPGLVSCIRLGAAAAGPPGPCETPNVCGTAGHSALLGAAPARLGDCIGGGL